MRSTIFHGNFKKWNFKVPISIWRDWYLCVTSMNWA